MAAEKRRRGIWEGQRKRRRKGKSFDMKRLGWKRKTAGCGRRALAWTLAFATAFTMIQTDGFKMTARASEGKAYTFNPSDMSLEVQSTNRDTSEQEVIDDYFTVTTGATKAGAQSSTGTYTISDEYGDFAETFSYSKRFSTEGSASASKANVGFTVSEEAESAELVIVAAVDSGKTDRGVALWKSDGTKIDSLELSSDGTMGVLFAENLEAGSSYYFGSYNSGIYIYYAKVIEEGTSSTDSSEEASTEEETGWNAETAGSFAIGGTEFTVQAGEAEEDDFSVTAAGGDGFVELVSASQAVIWADLGGDGAGVLSAANVTDLSGDISGISVSGNELTVSFDSEGTPDDYVFTVKDCSASGTAKADGAVKTYSMLDGSVVSTLYTAAKKLSGGASIFSTDRLVTLTGNKGIYYNGSQHGIVMGDSDTIQVKVAGDAEITFSLCAYSQSSATLTAESADGTVVSASDADSAEVNFKGESDGSSVGFVYEGDATTITFTLNSATGNSYLHAMTVKNSAPETETNPDAVETVPEILETVGTADNMTAEANGQKLTLSQTGGKMTTVDGAINPELSYYAFSEKTSAFYRLEADVTIASVEASGNYYGIFLGAFNEDAAVLAGIRNQTNIRGIYSKSVKDMLGAGQVNQTMTAGETLHINAYKQDDYFYIETTCEADDLSYTSKFKYNASDVLLFTEDGTETEAYYGLVAAGVTAVVSNMTYYDENGDVLFDQNEYYLPLGSAPVVKTVSAAGDDSREFITVSWTGEALSGDGKYVLQVSKDGGDYEDVADGLTEMTYSYPVSEAGTYTFRVCGTLGNSDEQALENRNDYVTSDPVEIVAALTAPEIELDYTSAASGVELSWSETENAVRYDVYRRSGDEDASVKIAETTTNTYTDTTVEAEVPYYYSVQVFSEDNYSNLSEEAWTLPTDGHEGTYSYEDGELVITKKSYDTVYDGTVYLEGVATEAGTVTAYVNEIAQGSVEVGVRDTFRFQNLKLEEGRNDVTLILTQTDGTQVRKSLNFVYLTNYDMVVDASYTGEDGAEVDGIPYYSTVQAAVDAVPATNESQKIILIKAGDYEEENDSTKQLIVDKPYVSLIGEDSEMVCLHNQPLDLETDASTTTTRCFLYVTSAATGFSAENLTVENDWEYRGDGSISNESADAILSEAEGAVYTNVRFLGYQDTINPNKNHQYFYKCYIAGNVDFIYGSAGMVLFEDCDIVFRYNANKNSGYVTAPKSDGVSYGLIFDNCRITAEKGCSGSKYYLGRPWGEEAAVTYIDCYMSSIINAEIGWTDWSGEELSTNVTALEKSRYYECGTYGAGYAVNANRRQISPAAAEEMLSASALGWNPEDTAVELATNYVGDIETEQEANYVETAYEPDTYSGYESDDTGAGRYNQEGFAEVADTTGGGLLYETSDDYYKVSNAEEFLTAMIAIKKSGMPSVIELDADICLGSNEVENFASYSSVITAHSHEPLTHPLLMETGVSKLSMKGMSNLTIFSTEGYSIKHCALDINASENIIIRNISFDELWEWDEETSGGYDVNDWDYVTVETGSDRVWIDHCTFYKSYDGIVDVKTDKTTETNVTISWCEFLPGSEDNVFFDEMMETMAADPENYPYYNSLLEKGMSDEQIWWYAYGQKKTHLIGQSDDATTAENINLTLANNYYYNSMDRMPRMRYGTAHVYNCILDAQELLNARDTITDSEAAAHIVSNGASSTCDGSVLLENCFVNGIINALNSGNGSSPSGYINAVNSLYYMYGERYALTPKVNTTKEGEELKLLDADSFVSELPYEDYVLYSASELYEIVRPNAGAGKQDWSALQWEKTVYYDATWEAPVAETTSNDGLPSYSGQKGSTSTDDGDSDSGDSDSDASDSDDSDSDDSDSGNSDGDSDEEDSKEEDSDTTEDTASDGNTTTSDGSTSSNTTSDGTKDKTTTSDTTTDDTTSDGTASSTTASAGTASSTTTGSTATAVATVAGAVSVASDAAGDGQTSEDAAVVKLDESSWEEIVSLLEQLEREGETKELVISMAQDGVIPAEFWQALAGKDIQVTLAFSDDYAWKINGTEITGTVEQDIDMSLEQSTGAIPEIILEKLECTYLPLSLAYTGQFGFRAVLHIKTGNDGAMANLFYYNEETGMMEHMESVQVSEDGYAEFAFTHASDYIIVMSETALASWDEVSEKADETVAEEQTTEEVESSQTVEASHAAGIIAIIVVIIMAAGAAGYVCFRKKKKK